MYPQVGKGCILKKLSNTYKLKQTSYVFAKNSLFFSMSFLFHQEDAGEDDVDDASEASEISVGTFSPWKPRQLDNTKDKNIIERTVFTETISEISSYALGKKSAWLDQFESNNIKQTSNVDGLRVPEDDSLDEIIDVENFTTFHKPKDLKDQNSEELASLANNRFGPEHDDSIIDIENDDNQNTSVEPIFVKNDQENLNSVMKVKSNEKYEEKEEFYSQISATVVALDHSYGMPKSESSLDDVVLTSEADEKILSMIDEDDVLEVVPELTSTVPQSPPALSKQLFQHRSFEEDDELVSELLKSGLDYEDAYYLKVGFERLLQVGSESVSNVRWTFHPNILSQYKDMLYFLMIIS